MGSLAAAPSHYLLRFANETNLTVFLIAQDNEINSLFWLLLSLKEKGSATVNTALVASFLKEYFFDCHLKKL